MLSSRSRIRGGAALCYLGPPTSMDLWKLYRKHCAALFLQDKDPGSQQTRTRRHFDLASPLSRITYMLVLHPQNKDNHKKG